MQSHIISATEASRSLSSILNKVHYQGQSFEIRRGKEVIAKIVPALPKRHKMTGEELVEFLKNLPTLGEDNEIFEKDLKEIRAHTRLEDNLWD